MQSKLNNRLFDRHRRHAPSHPFDIQRQFALSDVGGGHGIVEGFLTAFQRGPAPVHGFDPMRFAAPEKPQRPRRAFDKVRYDLDDFIDFFVVHSIGL